MQKNLSRAQNFNFRPIHEARVTNHIADCLSRLCGVVSKTEHTPDNNLRLVPMSKKAEVFFKKKLEIKDPLVEKKAEIGG